MEEETQVNPAELLELISGLSEKEAGDDKLDQGQDYRKGENCLCASSPPWEYWVEKSREE
jgi:hypothetical protein